MGPCAPNDGVHKNNVARYFIVFYYMQARNSAELCRTFGNINILCKRSVRANEKCRFALFCTSMFAERGFIHYYLKINMLCVSIWPVRFILII